MEKIELQTFGESAATMIEGIRQDLQKRTEAAIVELGDFELKGFDTAPYPLDGGRLRICGVGHNENGSWVYGRDKEMIRHGFFIDCLDILEIRAVACFVSWAAKKIELEKDCE